MENKVEDILQDYYSEYDEDGRLVKDKVHNLEFITTTTYIDRFIKEGDEVLEIGAGTGRYSIYYAEKGYKVEAVELIEKNIQILRKKVKDDMKIKATIGNEKI